MNWVSTLLRLHKNQPQIGFHKEHYMSLFDNFDPNALPDKNTVGSTAAKIRRIGDEPVICKLVPILNMQDSSGKPLLYFPFSRFKFSFVKNGKQENWTRPSLGVFAQKDPQQTKYLEMKKELDELKKTLKSSGAREAESVEFNVLKKKVDELAPQRKAIIFVHVFGSSTIEAMEIPGTLVEVLFGREEWGDKPAVEGLYQECKRKGLNLFDIRSNTGWVKLYRTGTTWNDTKYNAEQARTQSIEDGEEVLRTLKAPPSSAVFELKDTDLPDARAVAGQWSWTEEEVLAYLSEGLVPSKVFGNNGDKTPKTDEPKAAAAPAAATYSAQAPKVTIPPVAKATAVNSGMTLDDVLR